MRSRLIQPPMLCPMTTIGLRSGNLFCVGESLRISLKNTRAIIDAIHSGALAKAKTERDPVFGFEIVTEVPGVPQEILRPN